MRTKFFTGVALVALVGTTAVLWAPWASSAAAPSACGTSYAPMLNPAHFVTGVDNPYFPLPVGRTLVYTGIKDGQTQTDTVIVTDQTKVILGITATAVSDIATHDATVLEKTLDFYAQDEQGNVWYLGEDTTAFLPNGKTDTSGSFLAGVDGAQPGIIMEGSPKPGDFYWQFHWPGHALDRARVLRTGVPVTVPYRSFGATLLTQEQSPLEPGIRDWKWSAPGIGYVKEKAHRGSHEQIRLVSFRR
jgi:hypothetical protein